MFTAESWPISCNLLPFGGAASYNTPIRQAPARVRAGVRDLIVNSHERGLLGRATVVPL
jgi:hypothetical protein